MDKVYLIVAQAYIFIYLCSSSLKITTFTPKSTRLFYISLHCHSLLLGPWQVDRGRRQRRACPWALLVPTVSQLKFWKNSAVRIAGVLGEKKKKQFKYRKSIPLKSVGTVRGTGKGGTWGVKTHGLSNASSTQLHPCFLTFSHNDRSNASSTISLSIL